MSEMINHFENDPSVILTEPVKTFNASTCEEEILTQKAYDKEVWLLQRFARFRSDVKRLKKN